MYRAALISMKDTPSLNRTNNPKWQGQLNSKHKRWGVPKAPNINPKSTSLTVNSPKTIRLNPTVSGLPQLLTMLNTKMQRPLSTMLGHKHANTSKKFLPRNLTKSHGVQVHWQRMSETTQLQPVYSIDQGFEKCLGRTEIVAWRWSTEPGHRLTPVHQLVFRCSSCGWEGRYKIQRPIQNQRRS